MECMTSFGRKLFHNQLLDTHDMLRGDRRWYQIREQFGRRLPTSFEDRKQLAIWDRPRCRTDIAHMRKAMWTRTRLKGGKQVKRWTSATYRHRSVGGDRWSTQPPKWVPRFTDKKPKVMSSMLY